MAQFKSADRDTPFLFLPSVQNWLPQDHFARYVVEVLDRLDLQEFEKE